MLRVYVLCRRLCRRAIGLVYHGMLVHTKKIRSITRTLFFNLGHSKFESRRCCQLSQALSSALGPKYAFAQFLNDLGGCLVVLRRRAAGDAAKEFASVHDVGLDARGRVLAVHEAAAYRIRGRGRRRLPGHDHRTLLARRNCDDCVRDVGSGLLRDA